MISGSVAASFYFIPRMTNDVDFVVQIYQKDKKILIELFAPDFYISSESLDDAFGTIGMFNIIHNKSVLKCDLIVLKDDAFSQTAFKRSIPIQFEETILQVISMEDLILQKLLWRKETKSEQQLLDVMRIKNSNENSIDKIYLFKWAKELKVLGDVAKLFE